MLRRRGMVGLAVALAWMGASLSPVAAEDTGASNRPCETDAECGADHLVCDAQTSMCVCRDANSILSPSGHCLTSRRLEERCSFTDQCLLHEKHSVCNGGVCVCGEGFAIQSDRNGTATCVQSREKSVPKTYIDPNMIIILSVLAVMFVGICLALHLFSKARFRNRRTIFNSPHPRLMHIKLGKRKASNARRHSHASLPVPGSRRHSVSSQASPARSRTASIGGRRTSSHENLRSPSRKSPMGDRKMPAPLAENESVPSTEELARKAVHDAPSRPILNSASSLQINGGLTVNSPTVIVTSESGTVVRSPDSATSTTAAAV